MKKIICLFCILAGCANLQAEASWGGGYKYVDAGGIYTGATIPTSVAKNVDNKNEKFATLRRGETSRAEARAKILECGVRR